MLSIGCSLLPDGCTLVIRMSFILMMRYSCWPLPALREIRVASLMCSPVAHFVISTGDALSTACMKLRSEKLAFPAPPPPPWLIVPVWDTPNDHDRMSISPVCFESLDSPLMSPSFKNTSTAIPYAPLLQRHARCRSTHGFDVVSWLSLTAVWIPAAGTPSVLRAGSAAEGGTWPRSTQDSPRSR